MACLIIPDELDERLSAFAAKAGIPKDEYTLYALEEFLEDQEDYYLALAAMERLESGEEKAIPFEEILEKYGIEHEGSL